MGTFFWLFFVYFFFEYCVCYWHFYVLIVFVLNTFLGAIFLIILFQTLFDHIFTVDHIFYTFWQYLFLAVMGIHKYIIFRGWGRGNKSWKTLTNRRKRWRREGDQNPRKKEDDACRGGQKYWVWDDLIKAPIKLF